MESAEQQISTEISELAALASEYNEVSAEAMQILQNVEDELEPLFGDFENPETSEQLISAYSSLHRTMEDFKIGKTLEMKFGDGGSPYFMRDEDYVKNRSVPRLQMLYQDYTYNMLNQIKNQFLKGLLPVILEGQDLRLVDGGVKSMQSAVKKRINDYSKWFDMIRGRVVCADLVEVESAIDALLQSNLQVVQAMNFYYYHLHVSGFKEGHGYPKYKPYYAAHLVFAHDSDACFETQIMTERGHAASQLTHPFYSSMEIAVPDIPEELGRYLISVSFGAHLLDIIEYFNAKGLKVRFTKDELIIERNENSQVSWER